MEILFAIIMGIFVYVEYKLYNTMITPFSIISLVYVALILFTNYVAVHMGFYAVSYASIINIFCYLTIVFIISVCFHRFMVKKNNLVVKDAKNYIFKVIVGNKKLILILFFIGLSAKYFSLFEAIILYGISDIKGRAYGVFAHLGEMSVILIPAIMCLYILDSKKKRYLVYIALVYLNLFLFRGKYGIIIAFLQLILFYAMSKKLQIKKLFRLGTMAVGFGILMFIVIYAFIPAISRENFSLAWFIRRIYLSIRHFVYYLISPIIATDYFFGNVNEVTNGITILFTVPINIFKALFPLGDYINPVNAIFVQVSPRYDTNVGGFFAEAVYNSNFIIAGLYIALFFIIAYYIFIKARYLGEKLLLSSLILSIITVFFFCNFLTVSGVVMQVIYLWILENLILLKTILDRKLVVDDGRYKVLRKVLRWLNE